MAGLSQGQIASGGGGDGPGGHQTSGNNNASIPHFDCPSAYQKWYCLNGASCFAVKIGDTILYNCRCTVGYQGQRCEYKDTDESYSYSRSRHMIKQATIAGVTTAAIFIVLILITAITIYLRRRREKQQAQPSLMISPEAIQRTPFGRALSRTDQSHHLLFGQLNSPKSPTFDALPSGIPSTNSRMPEQRALLSRVESDRSAPVARTSDASLSVQDETIVAVEISNGSHVAGELPHPYSLQSATADGSQLPRFVRPPPAFTTGS
ncbi:putative Protein spitz [Hypsibius exemplaris]|uniref:EGF-like domain-containing protein n=1 Tax=Hypsibius exemplaris TaxID=2072580 RepID=A0A1W0XE80_HYPEX|nr:putative Protein spitz [Hypsibius exemplaris]